MGLNNIAPNLRKYDKFDQYVIDSKDKTMFNSQISDIKNTFIPAMDSLTNKDIKPDVKKSIKKYSLKNIMKLLRD